MYNYITLPWISMSSWWASQSVLYSCFVSDVRVYQISRLSLSEISFSSMFFHKFHQHCEADRLYKMNEFPSHITLLRWPNSNSLNSFMCITFLTGLQRALFVSVVGRPGMWLLHEKHAMPTQKQSGEGTQRLDCWAMQGNHLLVKDFIFNCFLIYIFKWVYHKDEYSGNLFMYVWPFSSLIIIVYFYITLTLLKIQTFNTLLVL